MERMRERKSRYVGDGAIGGAVGEDDPAGLHGEVTEDLVDVGAWGEWVTTVLAQAMEDVGGDGPSLPLSHLGLLLVTLAPASRHSQQQQQQPPTMFTSIIVKTVYILIRKVKDWGGMHIRRPRQESWIGCGFVLDGTYGGDGLMGMQCMVEMDAED